MRTRTLGKTGRQVSEIGFGAWQIGADWGDVPEEQALGVLVDRLRDDDRVALFDAAVRTPALSW